jgi:hypothetical protein
VVATTLDDRRSVWSEAESPTFFRLLVLRLPVDADKERQSYEFGSNAEEFKQ